MQGWMLAELPWGLLPLPSSSRHGPAPLDKLQWQEEKERHRERSQRVGQPQESHGSIWAELHRHLHHPAAKRTPTTSVYRQGHHRAVPLKTGWGNENTRSFYCPTSPQSHGGDAWAEGKVLSSVGFPADSTAAMNTAFLPPLGSRRSKT